MSVASGRMNLLLGNEVMATLEEFAKQVHQSKTQVIKEAVNEYIANHKNLMKESDIKIYAGLLKSNSLSIDALEFQRTQRDEWE